MAKREITVGSTDQTIDVFIQDSSATDGSGLDGLVYNSASLTCYYRKGATGSSTQLTLATQTVGGAHSDGGFVEIDATNMPGMYRLDLSDTMVAAAGMLTIFLRGATNMAPVAAEIEVVAVNKYDAVRGGMTALPNANADAAGGLVISDAGGFDIDNRAPSATSVTNMNTVFNTDFATNYNTTLDGWNVNTTALSGDSTAADNAEAFFDGTGYAGTNNVIPLVTTTTTVTNQVTANVTAISGDSTAADNCEAFFDGTGYAGTNNVIPLVTTTTTATNLTNAPTNGDLTSTMKTSVETAVANQVVNYKLDHLVHTADADDVADNTIIAKLASKGATADWSSYVNTTDSLEAIRDRGDAAWITATSVTVSDKTGFKLASDGLDLVTAWTVAITGNITGNLSGSVGSVTGAVGSVTGSVGGNVTGSVGSLATQAKADVNAEVDTAISDAALATAANLAAVAADLPTRITKNTALAGFPFLMVDATDLSTAETGLTVTATRSLDGASFASCTNSVSEIGNGWYKIDLAAGDLNGNTVALRFTASGAATRNITLITQPT